MKKAAHKIINDPVYGFISIDDELLLRIIDHPWLQRMRRIRQLGMSNLVYPGAQHTRFQHVVGAMHLMQSAIHILRNKGCEISQSDARSAMAAMLLHDVGHGPFSHVLEHSIVDEVSHETISRILMRRMNEQMNGDISDVIKIFDGHCQPFLHQLMSSQLDTDRLDYLRRDCFFTGVTEGTIGSDRIIKMLNVANDNLVVESKGIYSIENFLIARRLMYWQVYLHKTVVAAEKMLIQIVRRASYLAHRGHMPFAAPSLQYFLSRDINETNIDTDESINHFTNLDDSDVLSAIKVWQTDSDKVLSLLSTWFVNRSIFTIKLTREPITQDYLDVLKTSVAKTFSLPMEDAEFFVISGQVSSKTYSLATDRINIMYSPTDIRDISEASDMFNLQALAHSDKRFYVCFPKALLE
ncbi:MAG: HD domain-containing protein [Bacteroidales bacterium]|nr:HD domain-containing protein [Bacteroidales bacterium]